MSSNVASTRVLALTLRWMLVAASVWMSVMTTGCASLYQDVPRLPSHALAVEVAVQTSLGRALSAQVAAHPGQSGFQLIANGEAAFEARVALADGAEHTLDLQYFSVGEDLTTDLILVRIIEAAQRGVRVRILLDDIHPSARRFALHAIASHAAIEVRMFNPFRFGGASSLGRLSEVIVDGGRLNRRMHNKLWVTDNVVAITGSRNLGDEYFSVGVNSNFYDVDLLATGPIVNQLSQSFDAFWNSSSAVPIDAISEMHGVDAAADVWLGLNARMVGCVSVIVCEWLDKGGVLSELRSGTVLWTWANAELFYDKPGQDKSVIASGFEHGFIDDKPGGTRTASELLIMSPYFIPSEDARRHLSEMRERGVRVAVLTNALMSTDSIAAHAGYARHRSVLLREGIELYEVRPESRTRHPFIHRWGHASSASLHAKVVVKDRVRSIVGTQNQDPRSHLHNTEAWIAIDSRELAADLVALFEEGIDVQHAFKLGIRETEDLKGLTWYSEVDGERVMYDAEPMSSPWRLFWRGVLGALIPEHML